MCKSFDISMIVGIFSYAIAYYIWLRNYKNDKWHAIVLFVVASIQFSEAILWKYNGDFDKRDLVKLVSIFLIPFILSIEPIACLFGTQTVNINIETYDKIIYVIASGIIFILLYLSNPYPYIIQDNSIKYTTSEGNKNMTSYILFYVLLIYPFLKYGSFNIFYILLSLLVGIALYVASNKTMVGSNWCLYGNIIAIAALFYPYIDKYFQMESYNDKL